MTTKDAVVSADSVYRYLLSRQWDVSPRTMLFVMLNPSTADATKDDPTIRRCMGFATTNGYGRLEVVNLFAFRAKNVSDLRAVVPCGRAEGVDNEQYVRDAALRADVVVAAWGNDGLLGHQSVRASRWLCDVDLYCLGVTLSGQPRHPLYLPATQPLLIWKRRNG